MMAILLIVVDQKRGKYKHIFVSNPASNLVISQYINNQIMLYI